MVRKKQKQILVAGRAGEITDIANPLTFSLIEKIFGKGGPYRKVLKNFGIECEDTARSFLVYKKGKVYSDINKENEILWKSYPFSLTIKGDKVIHKFSLSNKNYSKLIPDLLKKISLETAIITNIGKYLNEAEARYFSLSDSTKKVYDSEKTDLKSFLDDYENVIFISYLYELIEGFNESQGLHDKGYSREIYEYLKHNDYILADDSGFAENTFKLPGGFSLGSNYTHVINDKNNYRLIPEKIEEFQIKTNKNLRSEILLQCLKNNARLKTNIYIYFLNRNFEERARSMGIEEFEYLTIEELNNIEKYSKEFLTERIITAKKTYDPEAASRLSNILEL